MASPNYKLSYFNVKGLAEGIRYMFAYAEVEFEDCRIPREEWPAIKEKQPMGSLPVLEFDGGKILNQSIAIVRFLGKRFGLAPPADDPFKEALLEALVDSIGDARNKMREAFKTKTPEAQNEAHEAIKFMMDKLELLASEGYFYGATPTWVDIYFTGLMETINDHMPDVLKNHKNLTQITEKIKSKESVQKYIKNRPPPEEHTAQAHDDKAKN